MADHIHMKLGDVLKGASPLPAISNEAVTFTLAARDVSAGTLTFNATFQGIKMGAFTASRKQGRMAWARVQKDSK
jgi:hypothetical protein